MKKYFICDDSGNLQGPYSEHVLQVLHEEGSIRSDTRIRETQSSEWDSYSDIAAKVLEGNPRKEADESSYLIALPDGETEGPYTKEQMKALYRNGRLAGSLLCCKTGASSWEALETLIGENVQQTASPEITGGRREGSRSSCSSEDDKNSHLMPEMPPVPKTSPPLEETASYGNPPLQDERSTPSGQRYDMRAFWTMTMLYLLSPLLIIVASATYAGNARVSLTVIGIGILFFLYTQIALLINTWRAWKCIQPIARYGRRVPSAGQAVGLLFVPVFNLYWMYVCFVGLADNASWLARASRQTSLRLKAWPMFAFVLFSQLTFGGSIITGALPEFRPFSDLLSWLWIPWPIAVFWYTERIIQAFPRPQERKKKYSQQEEAR